MGVVVPSQPSVGSRSTSNFIFVSTPPIFVFVFINLFVFVSKLFRFKSIFVFHFQFFLFSFQIHFRLRFKSIFRFRFALKVLSHTNSVVHVVVGLVAGLIKTGFDHHESSCSMTTAASPA